MGKRRKICMALLASTIVISQLVAQSAAAAPAQSSAIDKGTSGWATGSLGSISLGSNIKASLDNVNIWKQAGGNILSYTINYSNGSSSNASLRNYFSKVITPGGSVILGRPINGESLKKSVVSKGSLRVTYYVNIGQIQSLKGLKFAMYSWDAGTKGYLKQTGAFQLPANYTAAAATGKSLNTFMNDIPVTASGQSLEIYKYNGNVYAKVGFNLTNRGHKAIEDPGYTAYLVSSGGSRYELALSSSQTGFKIQPQEKKTIYYVTEIPPYLKTDHMKLQFTQKDETLKLEYATSSYNLPAATEPDLVVNKGQTKKIFINNNAIEIGLQNASVSAENDKGNWSFQLRIKNTGNKTIKLSSYELNVKSASGKSFSVDAKGLSGSKLKPLEEKIIPLRVQIPLEVEQNGLQLEMIETVSEESAEDAGTADTAGGKKEGGRMVVPIAYFAIPYTLHTDTHMGVEYNSTNQHGAFSYILQSLQRFPWKDEDIIIAKLKITNTQSTNLSLPELKAALKMDHDDISGPAELLMENDVTHLAPGESQEIHVIVKIPYYKEFKKLKLNLYSMKNDEKVPFLSLTTPGTVNVIGKIDHGDSYVISSKGKNATVQENKTIVYEEDSSKIVYTEMLLNSEEQRQSKMARLQAYFKTGDGKLYEATSSQPDTIATPGVKQVILFMAKVPKSVDISDLSLYLGTGITGNKLSEPGEEATGFINVSSLQLSPVVNLPQNLDQVVLRPYTLSVINSNGWKQEGSDNINITFNYNLLRDSSYDMATIDHKLVLKMTDPNGQSQEKNLSIGTDLTEGSNNTYSVSFTNNLYKDLSGGAFRMTLYEEILGERIELGSQTYNLFIAPLLN